MLGFLHKGVIGKCHPLVAQALPFAPEGMQQRANLHTKALHPQNENVTHQVELFNRSLWHYVCIYNLLPQALVDETSVSEFQNRLTHLAKQKASDGNENWRRSFQHGEDVMSMFCS